MIWQYFEGLRRLIDRIDQTSNVSHRRQEIALSVLLAVTVVETFLNIFFRVVVSEPEYQRYEKRFLDDLRRRRSLDYKIKKWPTEILGQGIDFNSGIGQEFMELKEKRNALMHFSSSHDSLEIGDMKIQGLADTSVLDELSLNDALSALQIAEGMICELLRLHGVEDSHLPYGLHMWTGKVPIADQ